MYLFWPEFSLAFQSALQFTHSPTFSCFSLTPSLHRALSNLKIDFALLPNLLSLSRMNSRCSHFLSSPPTLAHIWQSFLMKKVKGSREEGCGGHLAACALTSTRLAGVISRWLASGGGHGSCEKKGEMEMWDGRKGYDGSLLIKTHTWHTPTRHRVRC